jgi:hypothetical protein
MTLNEIIQIIEVARTSGLSELELNGLKIKFAAGKRPKKIKPVIPQQVVPDTKIEEIIKPASPLDELTSEEILYYATPYYDELQAQKEEQKRRAEGIV